jgi:hypothetical protein
VLQPAPTPVANPQPQTVDAQPSAAPQASPAASSSNASGSTLMTGAQPMVPSTFDNRWPGVH